MHSVLSSVLSSYPLLIHWPRPQPSLPPLTLDSQKDSAQERCRALGREGKRSRPESALVSGPGLPIGNEDLRAQPASLVGIIPSGSSRLLFSIFPPSLDSASIAKTRSLSMAQSISF